MLTNFFEHQETVANNLFALMRQNGYSRLSLSKLTGVPRPAIDQILLSGENNINELVYNSYIMQINQTFDFEGDYLLTTKEVAKPSSISSVNSERSPEAEEALFGLECIMDIYSMYIR